MREDLKPFLAFLNERGSDEVGRVGSEFDVK